MKLQPTPAQAMALLVSRLLDVDDFLDIAAQWLADGMDSANLRVLLRWVLGDEWHMLDS